MDSSGYPLCLLQKAQKSVNIGVAHKLHLYARSVDFKGFFPDSKSGRRQRLVGSNPTHSVQGKVSKSNGLLTFLCAFKSVVLSCFRSETELHMSCTRHFFGGKVAQKVALKKGPLRSLKMQFCLSCLWCFPSLHPDVNTLSLSSRRNCVPSAVVLQED